MVNPMEEEVCEHASEGGCQETECKHYSTKHPFNCNTNWSDEEFQAYADALKEEEAET